MTESAATDPRLALSFCGLHFATPLVLLSGCVGFGEEYTRVAGFSNRDAGAVCLKGTTGEPRLGNWPHRVYETPGGMLNAIGLQNPGVDKVVREILPTLDFTETRFIANVSGSTVEEYHEVTRRFDDSPIDAIEINISCPNVKEGGVAFGNDPEMSARVVAVSFSETRFIANVSGSTVEEYIEVTRRFDDSPIDAIEINISCPNVKEGGVAFGNDPEMSARVVAACRKATRKPLITKLSPNQTDIALNARRCIEAGTDGFSVINTLMGMAIDIESRTPVIGNNQGGLSGPAIKPIALLKVHQVARPHGIPIIGQGGVTTPEDAIEFLIAGATAVGVGTALFYDPLVCRKINAGILSYLDRHGLGSVGELTGTLRLHAPPVRAPQCTC